MASDNGGMYSVTVVDCILDTLVAAAAIMMVLVAHLVVDVARLILVLQKWKGILPLE
jgi:hypothetical protein